MDNANSEKRQAGRPKLQDGDARSKVISIRLTPRGFERMQALAARSNRTVADYAREVLKQIVTGQVLVRVPPPEKKPF